MRTSPRPTARRVALATALLASVGAGLAPSAHAQVLASHRPSRSAPIVAAAGDVACDPHTPAFNHLKGEGDRCRMLATSKLLRRMALTGVLGLGDLQYDDGTLTKYRSSYRPTWGHLKSITYPAPGNHEYWSSDRAAGYFAYFGARAGSSDGGYYSTDIGSWHVVALNSECDWVPCKKGSAQYDWLKTDLETSTASCTLAFWHEPRFSSGPHGGTNNVLPFWRLLYRYGADVVLSGHDHIYERFGRQTPLGAKDRAYGIQEFVVGTGGEEHYPIVDRQPHSIVRNTDAFGVLRLALSDGSYSWRFVPIHGAGFHDAGQMTCHGAP